MNGTVLIADDDMDLCDILAIKCDQAGLETIVVDNAESAMIAIECEQVDFAIMDVRMPSADGADVFDLLATNPAMSQLPVAILTGCQDDDTIGKCRSLAAHYIRKGPRMWQRLSQAIDDSIPSWCRKEPGRSERQTAVSASQY